MGKPYEVIVVNDASTDTTADIARQHNAVVLEVNHRQIAATRNAGGRAARGEQLFFVDADTTVNPRAVKSALEWMEKGAAGGGALTRFDGSVPLYSVLLLWWLGAFMKLAGISAGAFMFCTRQAFCAVNGFDERLYGGEDAAMSLALKRQGRFVVLREPVVTSGRRVRAMTGLQILGALARMAFFPSTMLTRRSAVERIWYGSKREDDKPPSGSLAVRISNAFALVILVVLVTLPIWIVPWPQTFQTGPLGAIRFSVRMILAHVGLALWPCLYYLLRSLLGQKRWVERVKLMALIGLSFWFAWGSTSSVICFWQGLYHCLAR